MKKLLGITFFMFSHLVSFSQTRPNTKPTREFTINYLNETLNKNCQNNISLYYSKIIKQNGDKELTIIVDKRMTYALQIINNVPYLNLTSVSSTSVILNEDNSNEIKKEERVKIQIPLMEINEIQVVLSDSSTSFSDQTGLINMTMFKNISFISNNSSIKHIGVKNSDVNFSRVIGLPYKDAVIAQKTINAINNLKSYFKKKDDDPF